MIASVPEIARKPLDMDYDIHCFLTTILSQPRKNLIIKQSKDLTSTTALFAICIFILLRTHRVSVVKVMGGGWKQRTDDGWEQRKNGGGITNVRTVILSGDM